MKDLFLHQQLALLALHDSKGTFSGSFYEYAFAGGLVSELLLAERIAFHEDEKRVRVASDQPMGNELLDELLELIRDSAKEYDLKHWVGKAAGLKNLKHRIADSLADAGIVQQDEKKILWLFTQKIYPELDGAYEDQLRARMASVMFHEGDLDVRSLVLIALAKHSNLLQQNFARVELEQHRDRVEQISKGDLLAAGATREVIEAIQAAVMVATMIPVMVSASTAANL